jgi:hypothetical protein
MYRVLDNNGVYLEFENRQDAESEMAYIKANYEQRIKSLFSDLLFETDNLNNLTIEST